MNILIVSQYYWPENFRINDLTKELISRGHKVTVLTGIPNYPSGRVFEEYGHNPKKFENHEGAKVIRVPMMPRGNGGKKLLINYASFVMGATLWGPWRLRGISADVIFVFEPSPVTVGLPAVLLGKIKKAPVVFWALDLWPETLVAMGAVRSQQVLSLIGRMVRFIYNRCTLVLGQSRSFLESIAKYCNDRQKIRYFPSWAEDIFASADVLPANEVVLNKTLFTIVFAGNIGEAQDMPAVLDAAERLKDHDSIRWVVVGDGRRFEWLQEEVVQRGLKEKVFLLGRFPVERMPSFYAHADVLLVSLKRDPVFSMTIPGKVQSYLMSGLPIVGMLDGEGAKVIKDANAGMVCPAGDGKGLAEQVLKMQALGDDERLALGSNGRNYAVKEFDRGALINKLESLLNEAVVTFRNKK
jgi:glycosyltransferase involved in cell wall biosynthesis